MKLLYTFIKSGMNERRKKLAQLWIITKKAGRMKIIHMVWCSHPYPFASKIWNHNTCKRTQASKQALTLARTHSSSLCIVYFVYCKIWLIVFMLYMDEKNEMINDVSVLCENWWDAVRIWICDERKISPKTKREEAKNTRCVYV